MASAEQLTGEWASVEAFGNTALDWSQAVRDGKATAKLSFSCDGKYSLRLLDTQSEEHQDVTASFSHVLASEGVFEVLEGNALSISGEFVLFIGRDGAEIDNANGAGDTTGIRWSFQLEEDNTLRIRSEIARHAVG